MPDTTGPEAYRLDRRQIRRAADRAAASYDKAAVFQSKVRNRLLERAADVSPAPASILDAGCATGHGSRALSRKFRRARCVAFDLSIGMLRCVAAKRKSATRIAAVCGDVQQLPFKDSSFNVVFSNLLLHWCNDIPAALAEFRRVLKTGGRLLFSTVGPNTLTELRQAWAKADDRVHVHRFFDLHDIGDMALNAGLTDPVIDLEMFRLTYPDLAGLFQDLKGTGAQNATAGRRRSLTGRQTMARMSQAYEDFRDHGRLPATAEVIFGNAIAGESGARRSAPGEVRVPVSVITRRDR